MASGGPVERAPDGLDPLAGRRGSERRRSMLDPPDGRSKIRVGRQARDEMPVDVRDLIAEQLVVHLHRAKAAGARLGPAGHLAQMAARTLCLAAAEVGGE